MLLARAVLTVVAGCASVAACGGGDDSPTNITLLANRAPQARGSISNQTLAVGGNDASVDVSGNFTDPDGDALTYSAMSSATGVTAVSVSGSIVTVRPVGVGMATVTVTARDSDGLTAILSFIVTVELTNRAPQASGSILDQMLTVGTNGASVDVSGNFTDPDGDALTYSAVSSATGVAAASVSGSLVTVRPVGVGTATVTVTATDTGDLAASLGFTVTVKLPNRSPEVQGPIPNQTLATGGSTASVDVSGNFTDPDGDSLTYSAESSVGEVAMAKASGSIVTLRPIGAGTATVIVTARDPGGLTASLTFAVTVQKLPDLAVSLAPSRVTLAPGGRFQFTVTVRNLGDTVATATTARTFLSEDSTITASDEQIDSAAVPALGAREAAEGFNTVMASDDATPDTIYMGVCVDAVPEEANTANNCSPAVEIVVHLASGGAISQSSAGQRIGPIVVGFKRYRHSPIVRR